MHARGYANRQSKAYSNSSVFSEKNRRVFPNSVIFLNRKREIPYESSNQTAPMTLVSKQRYARACAADAYCYKPVSCVSEMGRRTHTRHGAACPETRNTSEHITTEGGGGQFRDRLYPIPRRL